MLNLLFKLYLFSDKIFTFQTKIIPMIKLFIVQCTISTNIIFKTKYLSLSDLSNLSCFYCCDLTGLETIWRHWRMPHFWLKIPEQLLFFPIFQFVAKNFPPGSPNVHQLLATVLEKNCNCQTVGEYLTILWGIRRVVCHKLGTFWRRFWIFMW